MCWLQVFCGLYFIHLLWIYSKSANKPVYHPLYLSRIQYCHCPFLVVSSIMKRPRGAPAQVFHGKGGNTQWTRLGSRHTTSRACLQLWPWSPIASHPQLRRPHPSLVPSDLHHRCFWLITPNVVLIKTGGVKGFSSPEKRVQIVAQWQIPSLAWEEMQPDNVLVLPKWPEHD